jgi:hypothetical protein
MTRRLSLHQWKAPRLYCDGRERDRAQGGAALEGFLLAQGKSWGETTAPADSTVCRRRENMSGAVALERLSCCHLKLAEGVGFEPTVGFPTAVFKTGAPTDLEDPQFVLLPVYCHFSLPFATWRVTVPR